MPMSTSHIWLGNFTDEASLDSYFEEIYDEDDEDAPINRFAEGQAKEYYDHDWVERGFKPTGDLRELIDGHSYSADYIDLLIEDAALKGVKIANTFVMSGEGQFPNPKSVNGDGFELVYIGKYKCST